MGQKGHPKGFRLQLTKDWDSVWYQDDRSYADWAIEDKKIRDFLQKRLRFASISRVLIERAGNRIRVKLFTSRPGIIIGRKGQELEKLKQEIEKLCKSQVLLDIQEIKKPEVVAQLVSESVALQLERRISFRRAMKKAVQTAVSLGVKGIKVKVSGRLGGADIARSEIQHSGSVPLHTMKADVQYGFAEARTIYGIIGVKVWICNESETM